MTLSRKKLYIGANLTIMEPSQVIADFFTAFDIESSQKHLKDMLYCSLTNEQEHFAEPLERANLMSFTEQLGKLISAARQIDLRSK